MDKIKQEIDLICEKIANVGQKVIYYTLYFITLAMVYLFYNLYLLSQKLMEGKNEKPKKSRNNKRSRKNK